MNVALELRLGVSNMEEMISDESLLCSYRELMLDGQTAPRPAHSPASAVTEGAASRRSMSDLPSGSRRAALPPVAPSMDDLPASISGWVPGAGDPSFSSATGKEVEKQMRLHRCSQLFAELEVRLPAGTASQRPGISQTWGLCAGFCSSEICCAKTHVRKLCRC